MEKTNFNGGLACMNWLNHLYTYCGAEPLLGNSPKPVARRAFLYALPNIMTDYFAELRLKGDPGPDLSVQYIATDFATQNLLAAREINAEGEFFHKYAQELAALNSNILPEAHLYLESDSSLGEIPGSAIFINMAGEIGEIVLPMILLWQNKEQSLPTIQQLTRKCAGFAVPWLYGFMHTREAKPMRITMFVVDENLEGLLQTLKILNAEHVLNNSTKLLTDIAALDMFTYAVDLDILPNGAIGDTIGIQLALKTLFNSQQQQILNSDKFKEFITILQDHNLADDRIKLIPNCVWRKELPIENQPPYDTYSFISHFKLRWQGQEALPAKVYLQMRTLPKQNNINDIF